MIGNIVWVNLTDEQRKEIGSTNYFIKMKILDKLRGGCIRFMNDVPVPVDAYVCSQVDVPRPAILIIDPFKIKNLES